MRLAVGDVVADRVVEQDGLLRDDADLRAQRCERDVADVAAVDQDAAGSDVEETRDQMDERAFAGAARADDRDHFAGGHFKSMSCRTSRAPSSLPS